MTTDHVFVNNMELACRIGTTENERAFPQILHVSVRIFLSLSRAAETNSLEHTIDYAYIIQQIRTRTSERTYVLAEALASEIAAIGLASSLAHAVDVEVKKKVFEGIESVGAFIHREKNAS